MFLDLHEGVLQEFAAHGAQRLDYAERAGYAPHRRGDRDPEKCFDVEDPAAVLREAARLTALARARPPVAARRRTGRAPRPPVRCKQCRRRVAQPLFGRVKTYCDALCKQEHLGYRRTRCRICRTPFDLPERGRIKLYCSPRCQDAADRARRARPPRTPRPCRDCARAVEQPHTGKPREFCDARCRQRCYAREAGKWPSRAKRPAAVVSSGA